MKHAPIYIEKNGEDILSRYSAKLDFYKDYNFTQLMSIVLSEKIAVSLLMQKHPHTLRELAFSKPNDFMNVLRAIIKFERICDIRIMLFKSLYVDYLEFINHEDDRELQLKLIEEYVKN